MSNSASGQVVTFEYGKNGNLNKRIDGSNTTVYSFDPAGKLANITNPDGSTIIVRGMKTIILLYIVASKVNTSPDTRMLRTGFLLY